MHRVTPTPAGFAIVNAYNASIPIQASGNTDSTGSAISLTAGDGRSNLT